MRPVPVRASSTENPPERKRIVREPDAPNGLHVFTGTMISENPAIRTADIWQHLVGDHGTTVAYPIRTCVIRRRAVMQPPSAGPGQDE